MVFRRQLESFVLLLVMLAGIAPQAEAGNIYKYTNNHGQTVFDSQIPPQYVSMGYTILNEQGVVIQVVPRAPTPSELAARAAEEERMRLAEEARKAREEADKMLLRLYRSPEDINKKRNQRIVPLDMQRTALTAQREKAAQEAARLQSIVDDHTAANREVSAETLDLLRIQKAEQERLGGQIERLNSDITAIELEAAKEMKRLSELLGLTEELAVQ